MGGTPQPFIYAPVQDDDSARWPTTNFDPKAITRASYETKTRKPKRNGPLVSINRHPDAHGVPTGRSNWITMGQKTKAWIKGTRNVQFLLRILEHLANIGLLICMILINNVEALTGWVLRTTIAVAIVHCAYGIYHNSRPAGGRTPGSSSAYHVFAGVTDMTILPLYAYGVLSARNQVGSGPDTEWQTLLSDQTAIKTLVPVTYYGLIGTGGLHLISLAISLYLGVMFRRIAMMPPDMNPLESHLTSRAHKRNKSSVATTLYAESEKRFSTPSERHPATIDSEDVPRPRSMPFMHTRNNSHDSRMDLPSRQYQVQSSNSPRNSIAETNLKRASAPPRAAYADVPLDDNAPPTPTHRSRPASTYSYDLPADTIPSYLHSAIRMKPTPPIESPAPPSPSQNPRAPRFTEAWYASDSLVSRTQERSRRAQQAATNTNRSTYDSLDQRYDLSPEFDSDHDENENDYPHPSANPSSPSHPNPLRQHPTVSSYGEHIPTYTNTYTESEYTIQPPSSPPPRKKTPFARVRNSVLSAINMNERRVSGSEDITDEGRVGLGRVSSIGKDSAFYSKPYGALRAATPPVMVGGERVVGVGRQVSGNDYLGGGGDLGAGMRGRNVSGKIVEEGRGGRWRED